MMSEGVVMYRAGQTYEEIGNTFGVSKERIRQLLTAAIGKEALAEIRYGFTTAREVAREKAKDPEKEKLKALKRLVRAGKLWSIYSTECKGCGTTERRNTAMGYCQKCAYHFVPNFRRGRIESTKKWAKNNPERTRANVAKAGKIYREKLKDNPEKLRELREKQYAWRRKWLAENPEIKARYSKMTGARHLTKYRAEISKEREMRKVDPNYRSEWMSKWRERANKRYQRRKLNKLNNPHEEKTTE